MLSYGECCLMGIVVSWGMLSHGACCLMGHIVSGHFVLGHIVLGHFVLGHVVWPPKKESLESGDLSPQSDHSKSPSQEINDSNKDVEIPFAEPECDLSREVRGILVYMKGPKRIRRIQWKSEGTLVETKYFGFDNRNKLKFEEQRKRDLELEKTAG